MIKTIFTSTRIALLFAFMPLRAAPFRFAELSAIDKMCETARQVSSFLNSKYKDFVNAGGKVMEKRNCDRVKKFETQLICRAEAALRNRGAFNAGYHYIGCAKTFVPMGWALAEATLQMMKEKPGC